MWLSLLLEVLRHALLYQDVAVFLGVHAMMPCLDLLVFWLLLMSVLMELLQLLLQGAQLRKPWSEKVFLQLF